MPQVHSAIIFGDQTDAIVKFIHDQYIHMVIMGTHGRKGWIACSIPVRWRSSATALLTLCQRIAKIQGVRQIWGKVLPDNTQMLALGRKLNFKIARVDGEYELRLDLHRFEETQN